MKITQEEENKREELKKLLRDNDYKVHEIKNIFKKGGCRGTSKFVVIKQILVFFLLNECRSQSSIGRIMNVSRQAICKLIKSLDIDYIALDKRTEAIFNKMS